MRALRSATSRRSWRLAISIVAAAAVFAIFATSQRGGAMVGGAPTAATDFGRLVVMILGSSGTACTATAIGRDLLLTAAHCVQPGSDYKLVGSEPGQPPILKAVARIERLGPATAIGSRSGRGSIILVAAHGTTATRFRVLTAGESAVLGGRLRPLGPA